MCLNELSKSKIFVCSIFLFLIYFSASADSEYKYQLKNIKLLPDKNQEQIILFFSESIPEEHPMISHDNGLMYVRLISTNFKDINQKFDYKSKSNFINRIRVTQNRGSLMLEIILKSSRLTLENKISLSKTNSAVIIKLNNPAIIKALDIDNKSQEKLSEEIEERLFTSDKLPSLLPQSNDNYSTSQKNQEDIQQPDDSVKSLPPTKSEEWVMTMITMILSLLGIFIVLFILLYIYKKLLAGKFLNLNGKWNIRTISAVNISPKHQVVVLEIDKRYFACGISPNNITFLSELTSPQDQSFLKDVSVENGEIHFDAEKAREKFLRALEVARKAADKEQASQKAPDSNDSIKKNNGNNSTKNDKTDKIPNSFKTPVSKYDAKGTNEEDLPGDASMQDFAKMLRKKLKSLKPIE